MWLLTLLCDGCNKPLEADDDDRHIGRWMGPDRGKRRIRGTARNLADLALDQRWKRVEKRRHSQFFCPTCRLARERENLVPDTTEINQ